MDTAFAPHFRKTAPPLEQGLKLVKELGYAGVSWLEKAPDVVHSELDQIEKQGLKMFAIYSQAIVAPEGDVTLSTDAVPVMDVLQGHCDIFWLHLGGKGPAFDTLIAQNPAVVKLRALADTARAHGLKIAIYRQVRRGLPGPQNFAPSMTNGNRTCNQDNRAAGVYDHPLNLALQTLPTFRMLRRGFLAGALFYPSLAHEDRRIDACLAALEEAFAELGQELRAGDVEQRLGSPVRHSGFARLT